MLFLFVSVMLFLFIFTGVGSVLLRLTKWKVRGNVALVPYLGIIASSLYFSIVQFFCPLSIITLLPLVCAGAVGLVWGRAALCSSISCGVRRYILCVMAIALVFSFIIASQPLLAGDTRLYHLSIVSWLNKAKCMKGLAALHSRLGMNSSLLHLAGGVDVGPFDKYSAFIVLTLMNLVFVLYFGNELLFGGGKARAFAVIMLVWLAACTKWRPSLYYDDGAMMFSAITFYELLCNIEDRNDASCTEVILLLSVMGFCIKQLGAVMMIAMFVYMLFDMKKASRLSPLSVAKAVLLPIAFGTAYVARNVIQTGYPLFPLSILRLPCKWTVPPDNVRWCYEAIKYGARLDGAHSMAAKGKPFVYWFVPWIGHLISYPRIAFYPVAFIVSVPLVIRMMRQKASHIKTAVLPLALIVANLVFWFMSAPDFRFSSVLFCLLIACLLHYYDYSRTSAVALIVCSGVLCLCFLLPPIREHGLHWGLCNIFETLLPLLVMYIAPVYYLIPREESCRTERKAAKALVLLCIGVYALGTAVRYPYGLKAAVRNPSVLIIPQKAQSGAVHIVRLDNDQVPPVFVWTPEEGGVCADAPLPCTQYPDDRMKYIVNGDMMGGFWCDENAINTPSVYDKMLIPTER